jgi:formylglycine-generating enzyme required for sulfatase activity
MNRVLAVLLGVMLLAGWSWTAGHGQSGGDGPKATEPKNHDFVNSIGMKLVWIAPGKFMMGSPKDEEGRYDWEGPQHEVTISKAIYLGKYPVTRGQFRHFVEAEGYRTEVEKDDGGHGFNEDTGEFEGRDKKYNWKNTGFTQTDEHPVVNVTWNDARAFCRWLSRTEKADYRLPTEAEREFACRASTTSRWSFGNKEEDLKNYANIADASLKAKHKEASRAASWDDGYAFTAPVGKFKANRWCLHDMHGNVWEWCEDWYGDYNAEKVTDPTGPTTGSYRVSRGGSWFLGARDCRSARRIRLTPDFRSHDLGFRVALVPSPR